MHAVDLDSAVASWMFCAIARKRLVFDIYDKYTAVRNISGVVGRILIHSKHASPNLLTSL